MTTTVRHLTTQGEQATDAVARPRREIHATATTRRSSCRTRHSPLRRPAAGPSRT